MVSAVIKEKTRRGKYHAVAEFLKGHEKHQTKSGLISLRRSKTAAQKTD